MRAVRIKIEPETSRREKRVAKRQAGGRSVRIKIAELSSTPLKNPICIQKTDPMSLDHKVQMIKIKSNKYELEKHVNNLTTILKCSNATELDRSNRGIFKCPNCKVVFEKPAELKTHVLETHFDDKLNMTNRTTMKKFYSKLDVTDLKCTLCALKCNKLEDLTAHLKSTHQVELQPTLKNLIFEFDFTNGFTCIVCSNNFLNYKALSEHMNVHFRYYVCETCNHGYATVARLMAHQYRHKTGSFKCEECEEVFDMQWKKVGHIRKAHRTAVRSFKCPHCPERYAKVSELKKHSMEAHGEDLKPRLKCPACDKVFMNTGVLAIHKRKDHLLERNFGCNFCSKRFFSKPQLTEHLVKHTGEKNFQCQVCMKAYGREKTLREHMRIHADERRFSCAHCGQQFVQKCSWKSHMRSKHDEDVE